MSEFPVRANVTCKATRERSHVAVRLECPKVPFAPVPAARPFCANVTFVRLECPNVTFAWQDCPNVAFARPFRPNVTFAWQECPNVTFAPVLPIGSSGLKVTFRPSSFLNVTFSPRKARR